jgi:protease-4
MITESIEEIYDIFKTRVTDGRSKAGVSIMNRSHVDTIAEGRVWLGNIAKEIGLVDELGGLDDALKSAAKLANLSDYKISYYPKVKSFEESLFSFGEEDDKKTMISPEMIQDALSSSILGEDFAHLLKTIREIKNTKGAQARMPYEVIVR